jgi:DnaJ like chaperone protein
MNWTGKLIGGAFGLMVGGPLGAIVGIALGHQYDEKAGPNPQWQHSTSAPHDDNGHGARTVFYTTVFSVMGHLCKADGRVSESEIALARQIMTRLELSSSQRNNAMRLFNEGKRPEFQLDTVLNHFRHEVRNRRSLLRTFMEIQLTAAYADGEITPNKQQLLSYMCAKLGISRMEFDHLETFVREQAKFKQEPTYSSGGSLAEAYAALSVEPSATPEEIKRAYRRLMNQHHPDKLASKGLSEEKLKQASQRTHEIRQAYERIRESRGF